MRDPLDTIVTPASLGYFVINATDIDAWRAFATNVVGTMVDGDDDALTMRVDEQAQRLLILRGTEDDLYALGWAYDTEADLEAAAAQARAQGCDTTAGDEALCRSRCVERIVRLTDPNGLVHELHYGAAMAPRDEPFRSAVLKGEFVAGRLGVGHYVAIARDAGETEHFYRRVLGLRLSDYIRGEVAPGGPILEATFLHAATGRHHSAAYACAPAEKRIHHIMLQVADMDDVGLARERCVAAGVPLMMDLGRHPNDRMFSFYCVTPGGFGLEIGTGGIVIDDDAWSVHSYTRLSDWGHHPPAGQQ